MTLGGLFMKKRKLSGIFSLALIFVFVCIGCSTELTDDGPKDDGKNWTIDFDLGYTGGTVPAPIKVPKDTGDARDLWPENPVREGYYFVGWFDGETRFDRYSEIFKTITLTARWEAMFTVSFELDYTGDGVVNPSPTTIREGRTLGDLFPDAPERTGYTFTGWFDGETQYYQNTPITKTVTLTAGWFQGYTVKFTGTANPIADVYVPSGGTLGSQYPADPAGLEKFVFDGWYDQDDQKCTATTSITKDLTLAAKFVKGAEVEFITTVGSNAPAYKFTIPAGKKLGDYTKASVRILVSESTSGRLRMWGPLKETYWDDESPKGNRFPNNAAPDCLIINASQHSFNQTDTWVWKSYDLNFEGFRDSRYEESEIDKEPPFNTATEGALKGFNPNLDGTVVFLIGIIGQGGETMGSVVRNYYITDVILSNAAGSDTLPCDNPANWLEGKAWAGYNGITEWNDGPGVIRQ
jgi:uncharacterized repeat protein (TIGR02543 family)